MEWEKRGGAYNVQLFLPLRDGLSLISIPHLPMGLAGLFWQEQAWVRVKLNSKRKPNIF